MTIQRQEIPNHTPEQIRGYLVDAEELVAELDIDDRLLEAAFTKAVDLFASKQILLQETPTIGLGQILSNGKGR